MNREFLGRGWRFPIETDRNGNVELAAAERDVRQSIRIILGTAKGERVMRPAFGCGIHDHAFTTVNATTMNLIETDVEEALVNWEPRIEVQSVEADPSELEGGRLPIRVDYRVRNSNNEYNLVYPFYLRE